MAKNISKNQWVENIIDGVYIETAIINNILLIFAHSTIALSQNISIATLRNPSLFYAPTSRVNNYDGVGLKIVGNNIQTATSFNDQDNQIKVVWAVLKSKQLETDFYTPEQLAEMYPDDPAYQVATADLPEGDNPTLAKTESGTGVTLTTDTTTTKKKSTKTKPTIEPPITTEPTIASEVNSNGQLS